MFRLFRTLFNVFRRSPKSTKKSTPPSRDTLLPPEGSNQNRHSDNTNSTAGKDTMTTRSPQSQSTSFENLKLVLNVLRAYIVTFGEPSTELEMRSLVGAIVANLAAVSIENKDLEAFIDKAIAAYESVGKDASLVDVTSQLLAEQVSVWLKEQETTVSNVISAYLQQFAPAETNWESDKVLSLVLTVIATLNDGSLSKSGGRALIEKVIDSFDLEQALSRWVAPEWIALAQKVASYTEKEDVQLEVQSIAWAYLQQFRSILSPQLIEQIMETGPLNLSPEEVFSGDLGEFSEMLYYKYQFIKSDPVVTKSHKAIAADVHQAVEDFKKRRPPIFNVTEGVKKNDLEIGSSLDSAT